MKQEPIDILYICKAYPRCIRDLKENSTIRVIGNEETVAIEFDLRFRENDIGNIERCMRKIKRLFRTEPVLEKWETSYRNILNANNKENYIFTDAVRVIRGSMRIFVLIKNINEYACYIPSFMKFIDKYVVCNKPSRVYVYDRLIENDNIKRKIYILSNITNGNNICCVDILRIQNNDDIRDNILAYMFH